MPDVKKPAERAYLGRLLEASPLFRTTAAEDLAELARAGRSVAFTRGKALAPAKGQGDQVFVIEKGAAALLHRAAEADRAILVRLMGPGDAVGLVRVAETLSAKPDISASEWRTLSNVTAVAIPVADFIRVMRRSPELSEACFSHLASHLRDLTGLFASSLQHPLEARLAAFLERLGSIVAGARWEPTADLGKLQQTQIAELLGVSREHINRTLIMWERSGLVFHNKGGDLIIENRKRLSQLAAARRPAAASSAENERLWEVEQHINLGLNAAAFDLAMEGARRTPKDNRFKYFAALAMARMGALSEAISFVESARLTTSDNNQDIASIGPRLRRDLAFAAGRDPDAAELKLAAQGYESVFRSLKTTYPGVNAAETWAMAGDLKRAGAIAAEVRSIAENALADDDDEEKSYWLHATFAECLLLSGDKSGAKAAFAAATAASDSAPGKIATTRKQLSRLKKPLALEGRWIDEALPQGAVAYFCGPLTSGGPASRAALDRLARDVDDFIADRKIIAATGALAAGADIVIAERLIEAGVAIHALLPVAPTAFVESSVDPAGEDWRARFIACIEKAQTVEWVRRAPPGRAAYRLGARIAMGRAIRLADDLATEAVGFFSLQKGRTPEDSVSVENAAIWKSLGLTEISMIDVWDRTNPASKPDGDNFYPAIIVDSDDAGLQSTTRDRLFSVEFGSLTIHGFKSTDHALAATRTMLAAKTKKPFRLWLDVGIGNPQDDEAAFVETLITANCRPSTEPGKASASESFVFLAAATPGVKPRFEYLGFAACEEKHDPLALYLAHF